MECEARRGARGGARGGAGRAGWEAWAAGVGVASQLNLYAHYCWYLHEGALELERLDQKERD